MQYVEHDFVELEKDFCQNFIQKILSTIYFIKDLLLERMSMLSSQP